MMSMIHKAWLITNLASPISMPTVSVWDDICWSDSMLSALLILMSNALALCVKFEGLPFYGEDDMARIWEQQGLAKNKVMDARPDVKHVE
jgi:hypothetical protein